MTYRQPDISPYGEFPLSVMYSFVQLGFSLSDWQKVQLKTDLLKHKTWYLYTKING